MVNAQNGYQGIHRKLTMALSTATVIATTRAQVRPENNPQPAKATTTPKIRWTQPQVVASNWNR